MWCEKFSNRDCDPVEVRALKKQLASLSCRHDIHKYPILYETKRESYEQGVQVKCEPKRVDRTTQMAYNITSNLNLFSPYNHVSMCPTCLVAFGLLNGNVRKVMKDEELVTDFGIAYRDKSVENNIGYVSRTTSFSSPPCTEDPFQDFSSECVYDGMYQHRTPSPRRNNEVSFLDTYSGYTLPEDCVSSGSPPNVCMDDFVNLIRPSVPPFR